MEGAGPRSRRSTVRRVVIGVDVGGTKVLAGVVNARGRVLATALRSTPARNLEGRVVEDALVDAVLEVAGGARIAAVGVAAAGFVDGEGERVMFAPHLPWRGEAVRSRLESRWRVPVVLDNDANCHAVAEWAFGAAKGSASALMITLGTGIGGAILLGGRVHRGAQGMAGEFGHMQVVPEGRLCECGNQGCWEQYCSGKALVRAARERMGMFPTMLHEACGGNPDLLTGPMVTEAARSGDMAARQAFTTIGEWLGVGTANLVAAFDPDTVVVGGGVSAAGDKLIDPARLALQHSLVGGAYRTVPPIRLAELGPEAGMIGAAHLARRMLRAGRHDQPGLAPFTTWRRRPRGRSVRSASW